MSASARLAPPAPDRAVLGAWLWTRVATWVVVGAAAWVTAIGSTRPAPVLTRWVQWDAVHFRDIARYGYAGPPANPDDTPLEAFFPGLPLVLRALSRLGMGLAPAGLLVSAAALAVAVVALRRIGDLDVPGPPAGTGGRAVLLLLVSPCAVFLAAGYSEALFLALALPAWLLARHGRWWPAGMLCALATSVRVTGLFLALALAVEFLVRRPRPWRDAPALALPVLPVLAFFAYLNARTGDWLAWKHAQESHWDRYFTWPWDALATTWRAAFLDPGLPTQFAWYFRLEVLFVLLGVAGTGWLLLRRRWAEATYVGAQVAALATSEYYLSVPRAALLWFPLWTALAAWTLRSRTVLALWLAVSIPLAVLLATAYSTGAWAG